MASHHIQLWIKSYGQNSEQISFFSIIFKTIWALLNCVYLQTIVNSLIWHMSSPSLGPGPKVINEYKMRCHRSVNRYIWLRSRRISMDLRLRVWGRTRVEGDGNFQWAWIRSVCFCQVSKPKIAMQLAPLGCWCWRSAANYLSTRIKSILIWMALG